MRTPFSDFTAQPRWVRLLTIVAPLLLLLIAPQGAIGGVQYADSSYLTIGMITYEALRLLKGKLGFTKGVSRHYDSSFGEDGAKIGTVINVRKPLKFRGRDGSKMQIEDTNDQSTPVTLNRQAGVDFEMYSSDLKLSIDAFADRFLKPAIANISDKIDKEGCRLYSQIPDCVGTPGTPVSNYETFLEAGVVLDENGAPDDDQRQIVYSPRMRKTIVNALKGLSQDAASIKQQYRRGKMGTAAGFDWVEDTNIVQHVTGQQGGTPLVNGAGQSGSTIITDGWTAAAATRLKKGDTVQFEGCYKLTPQGHESLGVLKSFTLMADAASDGSGNLTMQIFPPMVTSGAYQNVSNAPANNAPIYVFNDNTGAYASKTSPQAWAMHKDAVVLACADLPLPEGTDKAQRVTDDEFGLSIRFVRDFDIENDRFACRFDVLYGWAVLREELACRIAG